MKMDNWFVDEFENIGFPSRVYIDTICKNINFGLFNGGGVFTAEIMISLFVLVCVRVRPEVSTYKSRMRV